MKLMKSAAIILGLLILGVSISQCKKSTEDVLDCIEQSLLVGLNAEVDNSNTKLVHLSATYSGVETLSSVNWDFGDGQTATTSVLTTTHTYTTAGSYTIKAKINLVHGSAKCSPEPTKAITIE